MFFGTKRRLKCIAKLDINGKIKIKQYKEVKYLECIFDCNLSSGGSSRLRFLQKTKYSKRLIKKITVQCIYPGFTLSMRAKQFPNQIQCAQNKCIWFCPSNRADIGKREVCTINWLPVDKRLSQHLWVIVFNYFNNKSPYMSDIFSLDKVTMHSIDLIYLFVWLIWGKKPSRILDQRFGIVFWLN